MYRAPWHVGYTAITQDTYRPMFNKQGTVALIIPECSASWMCIRCD